MLNTTVGPEMRNMVVVLGPTASGKTRLGVELARELGGEIVSADSRQVYRGLDIGAGKDLDEYSSGGSPVAYHLIDIVDLDSEFSVFEYQQRFFSVFEDLLARTVIPIVVGGSGLYLRALIEGISPIPSVDPELRQRLRDRLANEGAAGLRAELTKLDPMTAERLAPADSQRLLRALEVALGTGRPLSSWIAEKPVGGGGIDAVWIGLTLPRALLYDRIALRVERMLADGWVDEVERLLAAGLSPSLAAFQAIGYRELAGHIGGETTLEEATERIVRATRQYAKRQMTWFRRQSGVVWFSAAEASPTDILDYLTRAGLRL